MYACSVFHYEVYCYPQVLHVLTHSFPPRLASDRAGGKGSEAPAAGKPQVGGVTLATRPVVLTTELPGRTAAYRVAEVRPQVNGIVKKRLFTEGGDVQSDRKSTRLNSSH